MAEDLHENTGWILGLLGPTNGRGGHGPTFPCGSHDNPHCPLWPRRTSLFSSRAKLTEMPHRYDRPEIAECTSPRRLWVYLRGLSRAARAKSKAITSRIISSLDGSSIRPDKTPATHLLWSSNNVKGITWRHDEDNNHASLHDQGCEFGQSV
jgi:hypothetical protein